MSRKNSKSKENQAENNKKSTYADFDENMFPEDAAEYTSPITPPGQLTKYRAAELGLCFAAVILGVLYLYTSLVTLAVLLPLFSVGMAAVTVLRYLDAKTVVKSTNKSLSQNQQPLGALSKGAAYFSTFFAGALTVVIWIVTAAYFFR